MLRPAVEALVLKPDTLTEEHIAALRAYFRQWINAPVWDGNPEADDVARAELARLRADIHTLTTRDALWRWLCEATEQGLDPL